MPGYHFDGGYCEVAVLRDGQKVHVRLIRPSDKDLLCKAFARLSPGARYMRFFAPKVRLSGSELRYLTEMDQVNHFAIGAERIGHDDDLELVGVARFVKYGDLPDTAEAAITVLDEIQGKGLGSLLLQRLVSAARERGIDRLRFEVLCSNQPMQEFLHHLAPSARVVRREGMTMTLDLDLPELAPSHPVHEPPRQSPLYKLFTMAATGAVAVHLPTSDRALLAASPDGDEHPSG